MKRLSIDVFFTALIIMLTISCGETNSSAQKVNKRINVEFELKKEFEATGNEPFWYLNIQPQGKIIFRLLAGDTIEINTPQPEILTDAEAISFKTPTDKGLLNVMILDQFCINDMSGDTLPKKVEIFIDEKKFRGCGKFK